MTTGGAPVPIVYGGTGSTTADAAREALGVNNAITWAIVTIDGIIAANTGVIANKSGTLTMTLPTTSAVGDVISITGINTALGWKIAQNANQQIFFGVTQTLSGVLGSISSTAIRDSLTLICVTANTNWNSIGSVGNLTII